MTSTGRVMRTPPQRPLSEAVSNPDVFFSPAMSTSDISNNFNKDKKRKLSESETETMSQHFETMFHNIHGLFIDFTTQQKSATDKIYREISLMKQQNDQIISTNAEIKATVTAIVAEQNELKSRVYNLEKERQFATQEFGKLDMQVELLQRKINENTIEIRNLPTNGLEHAKEAIKKIHEVLNLKYCYQDIKTVHLLPSKRDLPKSLIVEFNSLEKKTSLLKAFKTYNINNNSNKFSTNTIGIQGDTKQVYLSELLTKKARHLIYLSRELVKSGQYKYCWTANGRVYVREKDGQPAVQITSTEQIDKLNKSAPRTASD